MESNRKHRQAVFLIVTLTVALLIGILGAAGAAVLTGCGSSGTSSTSGWSSGSASCVLTPRLTVGPYFVDDKLNRSDLTTNTSDANVLNGTPLSLTLTVEEYSSS